MTLLIVLAILISTIIIRRIIMAAKDTLLANIAQTKTDLEAFIASKQGGMTEVETQAAADAVAAIDSEIPKP